MIRFFPTPADWRRWLEANYSTETELLVGLYRKQTGKPSITWPESVDGALCFGWIDGVRRSIDAESYSIRFTPRKPRSIWSAVNMRRVDELTKLGLMHERGINAFAARTRERSGVYAFEQKDIHFSPEQAAAFRKEKPAWTFFSDQPIWYRRTVTWWVISAKREETRASRLAKLIADSAERKTLRQVTRKKQE